MTTYTDEVNIYNPSAVGGGIDAAGQTATNYIAVDDTGIRIANGDPANATTYQHQSATETEFVVNGAVAARYGENGVQIGPDGGPRVNVTNTGVYIVNGAGDATVETTINGIDLKETTERITQLESHAKLELVEVGEGQPKVPTLTLSASGADSDDSMVKAVLTNNRLAFTYGKDADPVAYIGEENGSGKLFVENAVVVSELELGQWVWTPMKNGNLALKWVGSTGQEA